MIATKQHTIDDFVGCARYLIAQRYTRQRASGGEGTSAGGILIGGAITQHPELFAAALDVVGVERRATAGIFPERTAQHSRIRHGQGRGWIQRAARDGRLSARAPRRRLSCGPADYRLQRPRVPPWELAKFAAALQAATSSRRPVLLASITTRATASSPPHASSPDRLLADQYSFLLWQFGDPEFTLPIHIGPRR